MVPRRGHQSLPGAGPAARADGTPGGSLRAALPAGNDTPPGDALSGSERRLARGPAPMEAAGAGAHSAFDADSGGQPASLGSRSSRHWLRREPTADQPAQYPTFASTPGPLRGSGVAG